MNSQALIIAALALLVACKGNGAERAQIRRDASDRPGEPEAVAADTFATPGTSLQSGLYVGGWHVPGDRRTHWLVVFLGVDSLRGVAYKPPRGDELCVVRVDSVGLVRLETGSLGGSMPYRLVVDGRLTMRGIRGRVTVSGAQFQESTSPIEMERVALGAAANDSGSLTSGIYASVHLHEETGDLLGDELFLIKGDRRLVAIYTSYEGEPDGPYVADTVELVGNTARIVGKFGTGTTSERVFVLNEDLKRLVTLKAFLSPRRVLRCGVPD